MKFSQTPDLNQYQKETGVILLSDIENFTEKTNSISEFDYLSFLNEQRHKFKDLTKSKHWQTKDGDTLTAYYLENDNHDIKTSCIKSIQAAIRIAISVQKQEITSLRTGLFLGEIYKLDHSYDSPDFTAVSRMEQLCKYFQVHFLIDKEIVKYLSSYLQKYVVNIGKITPKGFNHPIHLFTIYLPGINHLPLDLNRVQLQQFINLKNEAMANFCGNKNQNIAIDFPKAEVMLKQASNIFKEITGTTDIPTEKILEYIVQNNYQLPDNFTSLGMSFTNKSGDKCNGKNISNLANALLESSDTDLHHYLINDNSWENLFEFTWKDNELFFKYGDQPDGAYLIDIGEVEIIDKNNQLITVLKAGSVFGEMAFLENKGYRNASAKAKGLVRVQKISADNLQNKLPLPIKKILYNIAKKRLNELHATCR